MRRTVMFITTALAVVGLALPATAAPPDGIPPSSPPGQGGERPTPPGGGGGPGGPPPGTPGAPVTLSIGDAFVTEGITAPVVITADLAPSRDVTVDWTTEDGTAIAPGDYVASSGTATIPAGETTATVSVVTVDDADDEPDVEHLRVHLSNPSANATIADATAVVTIVDNDEPPPPPGDCGQIDLVPYPTDGSLHVGLRTVGPSACHELVLVEMPMDATARVMLTSDAATSLDMEMVLGEDVAVGTPTTSGQALQFTKQGEGDPVLYVYNTTETGIAYELVVQDAAPT